MEEPGVIYLIWNTVNGMRYVGQTTQPLAMRISQHKCDDLYVDRAIKKYGIENFRYGVIKTCATREELNYWERHYIIALKSKKPYGYNLTDGGEGGTGLTGEDHPFFGQHHTEKACLELSVSHRKETPYQNLLIEMDKRNMTYSATAKILGITQGAFSMKMRDLQYFMDKDADKLVAFFDKPAEYLFARADGKPLIFTSRSGEKNPFFGKHHKDEDRMTFSENNRGDSPYKNLLAEMAKRFISYTDLAKLLDMGRASISRKMTGKRKFTYYEQARLVEIFEMPIEYLLARDDGLSAMPTNRGKTPFKNLARELQQQNISYTDLGELLGLSHQSISEKMSGKKNFTDTQWQKLSEILGKPAAYLMQRDDG